MGHLITVSLTVSQKSVHVYIYDNFGKRGPIFIFFTVKFRKDLWRKMELKLPPFTQICCHTTLWKSVVNYTALQHSWLRSKWWNMF